MHFQVSQCSVATILIKPRCVVVLNAYDHNIYYPQFCAIDLAISCGHNLIFCCFTIHLILNNYKFDFKSIVISCTIVRSHILLDSYEEFWQLLYVARKKKIFVLNIYPIEYEICNKYCIRNVIKKVINSRYIRNSKYFLFCMQKTKTFVWSLIVTIITFFCYSFDTLSIVLTPMRWCKCLLCSMFFL